MSQEGSSGNWEIWSYLGPRGNLQLQEALVDEQRHRSLTSESRTIWWMSRCFFKGIFSSQWGLVLLPILLITAVLLNNNHRLDRGLALILNRAG